MLTDRNFLEEQRIYFVTWNKNSGNYENRKLLKYDKEQKKYISDVFVYAGK